MMFKPTYHYHRVYDITYQDVLDMGVTALVLDVDNTLTTHQNPIPNQKALNWLAQMQEKGIKINPLAPLTANKAMQSPMLFKCQWPLKVNKDNDFDLRGH